MFAEAINVILAIWERDPPCGIALSGNRYKVTTATTLAPELMATAALPRTDKALRGQAVRPREAARM